MQSVQSISRFFAFIGLFLATMSAAHAGFNIWNDEYTVSKSELQQALTDKSPKTVGDKHTLQMVLSHPVLNLEATKNRFEITADAMISGDLLGKSIPGQITVSSSIQYSPSKLAIILVDPAIESAQFEGVDNDTNQQIILFSNMLIQQLLHHYAVYTFKPDQFKFAGTYYQPTSMTIEASQVKVQMKKVNALKN